MLTKAIKVSLMSYMKAWLVERLKNGMVKRMIGAVSKMNRLVKRMIVMVRKANRAVQRVMKKMVMKPMDSFVTR